MSENTTGGLVEELRALLHDPYEKPIKVGMGTREHMHGEPVCAVPDCIRYFSPQEYVVERLLAILDAHASRTAEATCTGCGNWRQHCSCPPAPPSPEPGAVEALGQVIRRPWDDGALGSLGHLIPDLASRRHFSEIIAVAVLDDGYLSPADVKAATGAAYAKGWNAHLRGTLGAVAAAKAEALLEAADEMSAVIADGDVAEVAAPVPGEVGRGACVERRDALYEEPAEWLREYAATHTAAPVLVETQPDEAQKPPCPWHDDHGIRPPAERRTEGSE